MSVCEQSDVFVGPENVMTWGDVGEIDPERLWVRGEKVSDTDDSVVVKGRLKECVPFWKHEIEAPVSIINILESGYVLPLKSEPTPYNHPNHHSASRNASFVQDSILCHQLYCRSSCFDGDLQPVVWG